MRTRTSSRIKYEFTEAQKKVIGELVTHHFGANFQTSYGEGDEVLLYWQEGPEYPVKSVRVDRDGTVVSN
jgi:hypothetical protein